MIAEPTHTMYEAVELQGADEPVVLARLAVPAKLRDTDASMRAHQLASDIGVPSRPTVRVVPAGTIHVLPRWMV